MKIQDCHISGLKIIELEKHTDERGFFSERYSEARFSEAGIPMRFVQDNHLHSLPKVLRGLHYQLSPAQGKLIGVINGAAWDVAVDIRPASKTFGQHFSIELSAENGRLLWIPGGFAHGFCVLGETPCDMIMKVTEFRNAAAEGGIKYGDAKLAIKWPVENPIISARDHTLASWDEYCNNAVKAEGN
jgi:dTDP-4-dehydrorhamnose 3,5-epimerase